MFREAFLPFLLAVSLVILTTLGAELMEQVATVIAESVSQRESQMKIVIVRFGNVGTQSQQLLCRGLCLGQLVPYIGNGWLEMIHLTGCLLVVRVIGFRCLIC